MALKIRLRRMGRKKAPHYRIVVAESNMPRDGRFVATVGHYNPTTNPTTLVVDRDKALAWLGKGAIPTETVQSLFKKAGVYKEPTAAEGVVAAVTGAATAAASAAKGAAAKVAEAARGAAEVVADTAAGAVEAVRDAAEAVVDRVTGGDEGETAAADAPAAEGATADEELIGKRK
jgi:small subunit ribosomal protein S16